MNQKNNQKGQRINLICLEREKEVVHFSYVNVFILSPKTMSEKNISLEHIL